MQIDEQHAESNGKFVLTVQEDDGVMACLSPDFAIEDWGALEAMSQWHMAQGRVHWRVDLRQVARVDSRLMGLFIGLNAILGIRGGDLELLVARDSSAEHVLNITRMSRIMTIHSMEP